MSSLLHRVLRDSRVLPPRGGAPLLPRLASAASTSARAPWRLPVQCVDEPAALDLLQEAQVQQIARLQTLGPGIVLAVDHELKTLLARRRQRLQSLRRVLIKIRELLHGQAAHLLL